MHTMQQEELVGAIVATGLRSSGGTRARAAGAEAYIQTGAPPDDLIEALRCALAASSQHLRQALGRLGV
jgi:DNA-binding NarL/FixJ family response regulator